MPNGRTGKLIAARRGAFEVGVVEPPKPRQKGEVKVASITDAGLLAEIATILVDAKVGIPAASDEKGRVDFVLGKLQAANVVAENATSETIRLKVGGQTVVGSATEFIMARVKHNICNSHGFLPAKPATS